MNNACFVVRDAAGYRAACLRRDYPTRLVRNCGLRVIVRDEPDRSESVVKVERRE